MYINYGGGKRFLYSRVIFRRCRGFPLISVEKRGFDTVGFPFVIQYDHTEGLGGGIVLFSTMFSIFSPLCFL